MGRVKIYPPNEAAGAYYVKGSYTGDGSTANREIVLGARPAFVFVQGANVNNGTMGCLFLADNGAGEGIGLNVAPQINRMLGAAVTDSGFTLGNNNYTNLNGQTYNYVAIVIPAGVIA